jgi:hypothetical protein
MNEQINNLPIILAYYSGSQFVPGGLVTGIGKFITASSPVLFTVSVSVAPFTKGDFCGITTADYHEAVTWIGSDDVHAQWFADSVTFGSTEMRIGAITDSSISQQRVVQWSVTIMGNPGTVITVANA